MVVFSSLKNCYRNVNSNIVNVLRSNTKKVNDVTIRTMSEHRTLPITASRFQYNKFKDMLHLYVMVGAIPIALLVTYVNIFIGPATLTEIPEGYTPKHWEYYKHPITRFFARYIRTNPQQEYEKYLHLLHDEDERAKMRVMENKIKNLMKERGDYQAYYYVPYANTNFARVAREKGEQFVQMYGEN